MKEPLKTIPFLCCLSTINQIVNEQWLKDSKLNSKFIGNIIFNYYRLKTIKT